MQMKRGEWHCERQSDEDAKGDSVTKESELATRVMAWLTAEGWDCYPEVQTHSMSHRADIVAVFKQKLVWVIECKMSLSLAVLDQATRWLGDSHWVSAAVPHRKRTETSFAAQQYLKWKGIGLIRVAIDGEQFRHGFSGVSEIVDAPIHRRNFSNRLLATLHPDMKRYTPGTQSGYSTPYRRTMDGVREFISRNPGCTIKEIMDGIKKHHYSSQSTARSCIRVALGSFEKGIEIKQDGNAFRYFISGQAE